MDEAKIREWAERWYPWSEEDIDRAIKAARSLLAEQREEDARLCEGNRLISGSPGPLFNAGWHAANKADAAAIRRKP